MSVFVFLAGIVDLIGAWKASTLEVQTAIALKAASKQRCDDRMVG